MEILRLGGGSSILLDLLSKRQLSLQKKVVVEIVMKEVMTRFSVTTNIVEM